MKNAKKILSFLMTAILLVLCFPASVSAEGDDVVMESVEIISPKTLYMNFSVKMDNVHDPDSKRTEEMGMVGFYYFAAIRIVDNTTDWNLQYIGDVPLQWGGYCDYPLGFAMGETMSWTMVDTTLSCQNIEDILKLVRPGGSFEGCVVAFCLEEKGTVTLGNGYVDALFDQTDFNKKLYANKPAQEGSYDGAYVEITDTFENEDTSSDSTSAPVEDTSAEITTESKPTVSSEETASQNTADNTDTEKAPNEKSSDNTWIYIAAAVVVIAGIVAVVIIVRKRK